MITFITLTRFAATLAVATVMFGAIESAIAASSNKARVANVRDHRGPNAAPSGGVTVDGRGWKVQPPPRRGCHHVGTCPRPRGVSKNPETVVRDHRPKPLWPRSF